MFFFFQREYESKKEMWIFQILMTKMKVGVLFYINCLCFVILFLLLTIVFVDNYT